MQGWDSTVVRLLWVALVLFGGTGVLAYLVLWVVLPEEPFGLPPYAGYPPAPVYPYAQQQAPYPQQYPGAGPTAQPPYQTPHQAPPIPPQQG